MMETFDDHGVLFQYPENWEVEVAEEGAVTTISLHSTTGPAFALVTLDASRPDPSEVVDMALEAMREEYPGLDSSPAAETIGGRHAFGHDVEFFSLDMTSSCAIRCLQTHRRTVLLFGQWSDIEGDDARAAVAAMRRSFEESDTAEG